MKHISYKMQLILGFVILVIIICSISVISILSLNNIKLLFENTYKEQVSVQVSVLEESEIVSSMQREMMKVALSKSYDEAISSYISISSYETIFVNCFSEFGTKYKGDRQYVNDVLNAYSDWGPMRNQTLQLALAGKYDEAVINTKTVEAEQVKIIQEKMKRLVDYSKNEADRYYNASISQMKTFLLFLFILTLVAIYLAVLISIIIMRKIQKYEADLQLEKENLKITLHSIGDGVITTDADKNVMLLNSVAEKLTGWTTDEARGKPFLEVFNITSEKTGKQAKSPVDEVLEKGEICELENHTILTAKDGSMRNIADSAAPIKNIDGNIEGVVMVFRDVTERKNSMDKISYLSYHDSLTGLYNRAYFENEMHGEDIKSKLPISIIIGDVNGLKLTNDVYGHTAGDALLKNIAKVLTRCIGNKGIIARWGGDEYNILLPNMTNKQALEMCSNIKKECENFKDSPIILSISLGTETKNEENTNIDSVLSEAERIMYSNKLLESKTIRNTIIASLQKSFSDKICETKEHTDRAIEITNMIATKIHLNRSEIDQIRLLTQFHNIGKIAISQDVLNKSKQQLTPEEQSEMRKHPEIGYRIAQSNGELSQISELILTHHECFDGSGYPQGIKGEQIPKISRIFSIINAYDVMINPIKYKEPLSSEQAIEKIKKNAGTKFDPYYVDVFLKAINRPTAQSGKHAN